MNKDFNVMVERTVDFTDLDQDDQECWTDDVTIIEVSAENSELALDEFHATYPISVLDNFDISIKESVGN